MKDLYFLKGWNNYSNRILKTTERDISDFLDLYPDTTYEVRPSINFNPADGVKTGVTVNWGLPWTPSYLIVAEDDGIISSTWFVMEFERNLVGQYRALLRRDVLNDFKHETLTATSYIEKGTLPPSSPLIFNKENVGLNQIKKSETLLKDTTNSAWVVGYVSKSQLSEDKTISSDIITDPTYTHLTFPFPQYLPIGGITEYIVKGPFDYLHYDLTSRNPTSIWRTFVTPNPKVIKLNTTNQTPPIFNNTPSFNIDYSELLASSYSVFSNLNESSVVDLLNLQYKTLLAADNKMYKIYIEELTEKEENTRTLSSGSQIALLYKKYTGQDLISTGNIKGFARMPTYKLKFVETTDGQLVVNIKNNRTRCLDAPYDMFAIPYNNIKVQYLRRGDVEEFRVDPASAIAVAQAIQVQLTNDYVYDIQLLPYCPIPNIGTGTGINLVGLGDIDDTNNLNIETIMLGSYPKNVLIWCRNSIGSLTIPYSHPIEDLKVDNQTQMTRICSPNFAGIFEMSAAKNYGIDYMDVNFTYKPYNPFIHVAPNFKGLYGTSFNDARGLICGGDFSLAKLNDAWANYELQNKNYQAIFDRNIQSMDVMHRYDRFELGIGAITGAAGGVAGGAMAGGLVGRSGGALIGGVAGGVASAVGGIADFALGEARYKEQRALSIDQFGLQLDNIKALPTTLSKTTALTNNNKIWPFVEEYDCTDEEKEAFRNKLTYDGMTIGIVGKFKDYVVEGTKSYVKGRIIRFPSSFTEDDHLANTIFNEALMGFYTEG